MKKFLSILITCCVSFTTNSQNLSSVESSTPPVVDKTTLIPLSEKEYPNVDKYVLSLSENYYVINELSRKLTTPFKTDEDKIRAIYLWMTNNIAYDIKESRNGNIASRLSNMKFASYRHYSNYFASLVLRKKKGTCGGYSQLFYELCYQANIKCEIVGGFADGNTRLLSFFRKTNLFNNNHAWNRVKINGDSYYVDVTWSSGSVSGNKFSKQLNREYYLVPLDKLYPTHVEGDFSISCRDVGN